MCVALVIVALLIFVGWLMVRGAVKDAERLLEQGVFYEGAPATPDDWDSVGAASRCGSGSQDSTNQEGQAFLVEQQQAAAQAFKLREYHKNH